MNPKELYLKTSTLRLFFLIAVPGIISMFASALYGLFEGIFVGNTLGDVAFTAINLAFPFVIINFAISDLIAVGSAVPISISLGRHDDDRANNIFTCALIMIFVAGVGVGSILYFLAPYIIGFMDATDEVAELGVQYLRVYAITSPLITPVFALDNYLRISGKNKFGMWVSIITSVATVILEFLFLVVFRWGIWAASLAVCIAMMGCTIVAIIPFACGKFQLKFTKPKFSIKLVAEITKCGMPIFLANISSRVTSIAMNKSLMTMGGNDAVSTYGILMYVGETFQPMIYGICDSTQPAIGYNWGARQFDRVKKLRKYIYLGSAIVSFTSGFVMLTMPKFLIGLFAPNASPEFVKEATIALAFHAVSRMLIWFAFATQSYMTAVEKSFYATLLSVLNSFVFPMMLIFLLKPLGLTGLWLNAPLNMLLTCLVAVVVLIIFSREMKKKENEISLE